jgi:hypothetical protein
MVISVPDAFLLAEFPCAPPPQWDGRVGPDRNVVRIIREIGVMMHHEVGRSNKRSKILCSGIKETRVVKFSV